ncbi:MAG: carbonic anhydrase family protein, partial [Vicingaceae bacterium]|nr:carbonic anhydrase family protein [Vicingaceae bacterium]
MNNELIQRLKDGNERFLDRKMNDYNYPEQVKATAGGQKPFAAVLGCIDSRVPAEVVFDQGIGDIFNVRIAGNFVNDDILGSLEFACKVAGSKVVVVLGHTSCGAVKGACDNVELGKLTGMLDNIKPAIKSVEAGFSEKSSKNAEYVQAVSDANVLLTIKAIKDRSEVLSEMIDNNEIAVVGAMYDV